MVTAKQRLVRKPLGDPGAAFDDGFDAVDLYSRLKSRERIAVAVGSRKIDQLERVLARLLERLRKCGCSPFIVPAMGSHAGATAEGQERLLADLGVSEKSTGVRIIPSMETVMLGETPSGAGAFIARSALESDGIIVVNRVAPHTGYSGPIQSGAVKMLAVGLGKASGARSIHSHGFGAGHLLGEVCDLVLDKTPVVAAVALMEDGAGDLSRVEVIEGSRIRREEPELLESAVSMRPTIPVSSADILIVDEMGKDISGIGMDPLVTGRGKTLPTGERDSFTARCIVVLGLTSGSAGNATGMGHADVITGRFCEQIDFRVTEKNVLTSGELRRARRPLVADSDREAVSMALESLGDVSPKEARIVRIKNTRELSEFQVSEAVADELDGVKGIVLSDDARSMAFDTGGRIR